MSSVAALEYKLSQLKNELRIMQQRLSAVQQLKSGLEGRIDSAVEQFNKQLEKCRTNISEGFIGFRNSYTLLDEIREKREPYYAEAGGLIGVRSNLNAEENRCNGEISRLKNEIVQTEAELAAAREYEAMLARQAAENAIKAFGFR